MEKRENPPLRLDRPLMLLLLDSAIAPHLLTLRGVLALNRICRLADAVGRIRRAADHKRVPKAVRDRLLALIDEATETGGDPD